MLLLLGSFRGGSRGGLRGARGGGRSFRGRGSPYRGGRGRASYQQGYY
jgi:hypothetical protein